MKLVVPAVSIKELYLAAKFGPSRVGRKGRSALRFLEALGLASFEKSEGEFREALLSTLLEKLGFAKALELASSRTGCVTPAALAQAAKSVGVELSKTSARNLLRILRQLGVVTTLRAWTVYTSKLEDAVLAIVAARGEVKLRDVEKRIGWGTREAVLKLWAQGRVEVEGNPRGPLRGPLDLPRELVLEHGLEYPESLVKQMGLEGNPRMERFIERETGEVKYAIAVRGDDRVRIVVR